MTSTDDAGGASVSFHADGLSVDEAQKLGSLLSAAPILLVAAMDAYSLLADVRHEWSGRSTSAGQRLLCDLRDAIAKATDRDPQDVQDHFSKGEA